MMRLLCFLGLLLPIIANGQVAISGRVVDSESGEAIPYVTVAVKRADIGVISDREGRFEVRDRDNLSLEDSVVLSHVGFESLTCSAGQLTGGDISLSRAVHQIEEVVVTNRPSRLAKLGHSSGGTAMVTAGWFGERGFGDTNYQNKEGGVAIKIKHDSELLSFAMLIRRNGYDRALFRLSFYALKDNTPQELIVHRDIRFEIKDRFKGLFEVDLSPYDIRLAGGQEILVTLTLLEDEMGETNEFFLLDGALFGRGVYDRIVGSERWDRFGAGTITMYLNARIYK
jgi:hypothetical protein